MSELEYSELEYVVQESSFIDETWFDYHENLSDISAARQAMSQAKKFVETTLGLKIKFRIITRETVEKVVEVDD